MEFFAYLNRMKYIKRWGLMHSAREENIMEHSHQAAVISHALAVINNKIFKGSADIQKTVLYALYHETTEVITGDLPTPVKYYNNDLKTAYKNMEKAAGQKLLSCLPPELRCEYENLILPDISSYEYKLVKAADKLCAYIKCIEEQSFGNREFKKAESTIKKELDVIDIPEVKYFIKEILPVYKLTIDEL